MKKFKFLGVFIFVLVFSIGGVQAYTATQATAYSIGTSYGVFDINTSGDAITASTKFGEMGFNSYYHTSPTYQYLRGNNPDTGKPRMESKILFFSGHANSDHMSFNYQGYGGDYATGIYYSYNFDSSSTGYKYAGIYSYDMTKVELMVLGGCKTAYGSDNIAKRAYTRGVRTSLGWSVSIGASSHSEWFKNFLYDLGRGRPVATAISYANSFSYSDNGVKSVVLYGDSQYVPAWDSQLGYSSSATTTAETTSNVAYTANLTVDPSNQEDIVEKVGNYIKSNINNDFQLNDYKVRSIESNGTKYFDINLLVNGEMSLSGYVFEVIDGHIETIYDNTREIAISKTKVATFANDRIQDIIDILNTKILSDLDIEIVNQEHNIMFDINSNTFQLYVRTEIHNKSTDSYYVYENTFSK